MKLGVWKYIFTGLILAAIAVGLGISQSSDQKLHIIACDVGQGDATLITFESTQILIDGGPDLKILDCLGKYIPYWDRTIEAVILTHPQLDHYGGLIEVVGRYEVENLIANSLDSDADAYGQLKKEIMEKGIKVTNPNQDTLVRYGALYLDIVHPSREFIAQNSTFLESTSSDRVLGSYTTRADPNVFSIVAILSFGDFDGLFTGDITPEAIEEIIKSGQLKDVDFIKIPHHGSKNGLTSSLLEVTSPEISVISAGRNNRYGHPHQETLGLLRERNIQILRTDEVGDIEIVTDGKEIIVRGN